ncbi:MAG: diguanylate cyclase [Chloroflexota bacterium]
MTLRGFRLRVLALVMLAALPALLVIGLAGISQREATLEREQSHLDELARAVGLQQQRIVERVDQLLTTMQVTLARSSADGPMGCMALLADLKRAFATYSSLGVTDANGRITCADDPTRVGLDLSSSRIFLSARAERGLVVGDVSGFSSVRAPLPFGKPMFDERGAFIGITFATLPLHQLAGAAVDLGLPPDARVDLFDAGGRLLLRYPDPEGFAGTDLSGQPLLTAVRQSDRERGARGYAEITDLDGVSRSYAFAHVGGDAGGLLVAVGRPTALTVAAEQRVTEISLLGVLGLALVTLLVAWTAGARLVVAPLEDALEDAVRDPLTGLHNRRYLVARAERLEQRRAAGRGHQGPVAAIMFDLDHFGAVNKRWGHAYGDRVLGEFATVLAERFREADIVARIGGEEFAAILEVRDVSDAARIAEEVRERFAERGRELALGRGPALTVSAGVAAGNGADLSVEALLREADTRLRRAKTTGRDRVVAPQARGAAGTEATGEVAGRLGTPATA